MRAIYLIARREYLSYVATWGFWLSLLSVPMFMAVGAGLPALIESSEPTRYFTLIDETGRFGEEEIIGGVANARAARQAQMAEEMAGMFGNEALAEQVQAQVESAPANNGRYVLIPPPADTLDGLRPYLLGDILLDITEPPSRLHAAIFVREDEAGEIEIAYWSANISEEGLRDEISGSVAELMREARWTELGLSSEVIRETNALSPRVLNLNPEREIDAARVTMADRAPFIVGVMFAFMLWTVVFSVVNMLLTAMIEEKGNKILETLLSTARYHEVLIGKLFGVAAVSFTLMLVWGGIGGIGLTVLGSLAASVDPDIAALVAAVGDPGLLLAAVGYFVIGYLTFGALFLAVGSLCETMQEAQTLMGPIFLIMMVPLLLIFVALQSPDNPIIGIASWVPVWTPFIMLARLPSDPSTMELLGTTAVMLGTSAVVLWGAGAVFRMGALNQANADSVRRFFSFGRGQKA